MTNEDFTKIVILVSNNERRTRQIVWTAATAVVVTVAILRGQDVLTYWPTTLAATAVFVATWFSVRVDL